MLGLLLTRPLHGNRWIASLQGATTHSQSDRIVTARYSAFLLITQFIIFSLLGVIVQIGKSRRYRVSRRRALMIRFVHVFESTVSQVVVEVRGHASEEKVFDYLKTIPYNM